MDHIDRAIYDTVHGGDMSCAAIAKKSGMSHQVLINKANPGCETHKLGLLESVAIMLITGDQSIYRAIGTELEIDAQPAAHKLGILESALLASKEHGDVLRTLHEALNDGKLTLREKEACHREIDEAIASLKQLQIEIYAHQGSTSLKAVQS